jgi:hypothetical protein
LSYGNRQSQRKSDRSAGIPHYISGALSSLMMVATVPFLHKIGFTKGLVIGYTAIVLSFLLVFFGIRSYRDNVGNGQIIFTKAFAVGISITLISCIFYVVTWEILYFNFLSPDFMDKYGAQTIEKLKASGASPAAVQVQVQQLKKFKEQYENPLFNSLMTFIEPFPIELAFTLISAAVLRKKAQSQPAPSPLPAS